MLKLHRKQIDSLASGLPKPKYKIEECFTVMHIKTLLNRREKKQNERRFQATVRKQ